MNYPSELSRNEISTLAGRQFESLEERSERTAPSVDPSRFRVGGRVPDRRRPPSIAAQTSFNDLEPASPRRTPSSCRSRPAARDPRARFPAYARSLPSRRRTTMIRPSSPIRAEHAVDRFLDRFRAFVRRASGNGLDQDGPPLGVEKRETDARSSRYRCGALGASAPRPPKVRSLTIRTA